MPAKKTGTGRGGNKTPPNMTSGPGSGANTRGQKAYVGTTGKAARFTPGNLRDQGVGVGTAPRQTSGRGSGSNTGRNTGGTSTTARKRQPGKN